MFSYTGERGTTNNKVAGLTTVVTIAGANVPVGAILVVRAVLDNQSAVDGPTTAVSCSDSQGNTYTRLSEYTRTLGGAADGVTTALFSA